MYNYYTVASNPTSCAVPSYPPPSGTQNNGNVMGYYDLDNINPANGNVATYTYDSLNRLATAVATPLQTGGAAYNLSYGAGYDRYGNMNCMTGSQTNGPCPYWTINSATNQIIGFTYDAAGPAPDGARAGNLTQDGTGSHTYQWDAEGRVISVDGGSTWAYTYNAEGQRVQEAYTGGANQLLFDPAGNWLGMAGLFSAVHLKGINWMLYIGGGAYFIHSNHLGSTGMETSPSGAVVEDMAFYPWGTVWTLPLSGYGYNFAGMPYRDTSTNADITTFRHYSFNLGRWLSPDPLGGDVSNPQSLNRYAYVMNNPTNLVDPLGLGPKDGFDPCGNNPNKAACGGDAASSAVACMELGLNPNCSMPSGELAAAEAIYDANLVLAGQGTGETILPDGTVKQWVQGGQASNVLTDMNGNVIGTGTGPYLPGHWDEEYVTYDAPADYLQYTLNVGFLLGGTATLTVDKYARVYFGLGGNVGKSATLVSGSFQGGHVFVSAPATPGAVKNVLTGAGCSAGGGLLFGGSAYFNLFKSGTAYTLGAATPQFGISCTLSGRIF